VAPQMKCYELDQLAVKFERHLVAEIVDFQMITDDYSKIVFLCADRSAHFHAKFGAYHKIRTPRYRPIKQLQQNLQVSVR
jgi:ribosome biogenesis protein ENP2